MPILARSARILAFFLLPFVVGARSAIDASPLVSIWYRGQPAGVPRAQDLDEIRSLGFSAVSWSAVSGSSSASNETLRQLAERAGLVAIVRTDRSPVTARSATEGREFADIGPSLLQNGSAASLTWRAIAHGTRVVSFDPGGTAWRRLSDNAGRVPAWVEGAAAITQQLRVNDALFSARRNGPAVLVQPPNSVVDAVLLDVQRSWIVIVTNASAVRVHARVELPAGVPYAMWLNLLDGTTMAMLNDAGGPRWTTDVAPWGVKIYLIDKMLK